MSALSELTRTTKTTTSSGSTSGYDITSKEGLQAYANDLGLGDEVEKIIKKDSKMSLLNKLTTGLSAFETGNATYQSMVNNKNWFKTYFSDIGTGLYEAFSGNDITPEVKKTFKDVLTDEYKMKDRVGKIDTVDLLGLAGDILLDPTTYIPSGVIKKGVKKVGKAGEGLIKTTKIGTDTYNAVEKGIAQLTSSLPQFKLYDKNLQGNILDQTINRFRFNKAAKDKLLIDTGKEYNKLYKTFLSTSKTKAEALDKLTKLGGDITYYTEKGKQLNPLFAKYGLSDEQANVYNYIAGSVKKYQDDLLESGILEEALPNRVARILTPEGRSFISVENSGQMQDYIRGINKSNPIKSGGIMKIVSADDVMKQNGIKDIKKLSKSQIDNAMDTDDFGRILNFNDHKELHYIDHTKFSNKIENKAAKQIKKLDDQVDAAYKTLTSGDERLKLLKAQKKAKQKELSLASKNKVKVEGVLPDVTDDEYVNILVNKHIDTLIAKEQASIDNLVKNGVSKVGTEKTMRASTK